MKKLLILSLSLAALSVNAGTFDTLKNTPATKYEVGKNQLDLYAFLMTNKLKGEKVTEQKFKIDKISIDESGDSLGVRMSLVGKTKYITQEICTSSHRGTQAVIDKQKMVRDIWPSLSEPQYSDLESHFTVTTELVSKDNETFKISCN